MLKHAQTFTVNSSLFCITPDDVSESIRNIDSGSERERNPTSDIKHLRYFGPIWRMTWNSEKKSARAHILKHFWGPYRGKIAFLKSLGLIIGEKYVQAFFETASHKDNSQALQLQQQ